MEKHAPNIRRLAAFAATVRCGSVTAAANAIALTQPALTQAIARLEEQVGCKLFEREPAGMRPTPPALLLAERAERALDLIGSPRVTATQINAFLALARTGSYAGAAEVSGLSPASLHRAARDLSIALGETLVERRGRHLSLTRKGRRRARNFGLAMAELRNGFEEVADWLGRSGSRIVVGSMPLSRAQWLPWAIVAFARQRPGTQIAVIEGSFAELSGRLRDGDIDLLLGAMRDPPADDLDQHSVFVDRPMIAMRSGHPLAGEKTLRPDTLRQYGWVLPAKGTPLRAHWEDMLSSGGQSPPSVAIECGSVLAAREMLLDTDMLSILSPAQIRLELRSGALACKHPPQPIARGIGITTRKGWHPTPAQRDMVGILQGFDPHNS